MLPTISPRRAFEMLKNGEARLVDIRETAEICQIFQKFSFPFSVRAHQQTGLYPS